MSKEYEMMENSIRNSYYVMTGETTVEEIIERSDFPILFTEENNYSDEDIEEMLEYFISTEEYEKCAKLVKLICKE